MALCLATSLIECNGFDPKDQMQRYVRWWREGYLSSTERCFDIGSTVSAALQRFEQTQEPLSGSTNPFSAGNGSLMRLAPVPLWYARNARLAIQIAGDSSRTTHGAVEAVDACRYMAGLLVGILRNVSKDNLLSPLFEPVPGIWQEAPLAPRLTEIAAGSFKRKNPPQIRGTGYVVESLEAALWAFYHTDSFRDAVLMAVNLGDDADTTGAVCGQLAGAFYGVGWESDTSMNTSSKTIPDEWRKKIANGNLIESLALELYKGSEMLAVHAIPDDELQIMNVPQPEADWREISNFAITFRGYALGGEYNSIIKKQEVESLTELRAKLFHCQRRLHWGADLDEVVPEARNIVARIRTKLETG